MSTETPALPAFNTPGAGSAWRIITKGGLYFIQQSSGGEWVAVPSAVYANLADALTQADVLYNPGTVVWPQARIH